MSPAARGPVVTVLRDGSEGLVRPIEPSDEPYLRAGFEHLSARSREMRFLSTSVHPTGRDYDYLVHPDGVDHLALVMERHPVDADERIGYGVARCIRVPEDPTCAEVAVTVADEHQHKGVGTALLLELADWCLERGIERWCGIMRIDNEAVLAMMDRVARLRWRRVAEPGVYAAEWDLRDRPDASKRRSPGSDCVAP